MLVLTLYRHPAIDLVWAVESVSPDGKALVLRPVETNRQARAYVEVGRLGKWEQVSPERGDGQATQQEGRAAVVKQERALRDL